MDGQISDSRRQTGAGLLLDTPGAAMEVRVSDDRAEALIDAWREYVAINLELDYLGAIAERPLLGVRRFPGGLSLALPAPVDALYAATELNELSWKQAWAEVMSEPLAPSDLNVDTSRERDPNLVALVAAAEARGVCCLWDDEFVTLGLGSGSVSFPADALPETVDWTAIHDVPTVLVTGTNGKSTTVRMLAAMASAAGLAPGVSTTDYVAVGDVVIEAGDFSGPMGARAALRDRRAEVGILEVARGGLLRRGVPVPRVPVACITNVAADHLGEYGIDSVEALAEAKFVVAKALHDGGVLVLSADDAPSVREYERQRERLAARGVAVGWASMDADDARLADGAVAASIVDGHVVVRFSGSDWTRLVPVADVPSAAGGAARHNVRNALSATATAHALGLPDAAIAVGLRAFRGDATDNPGRANVTQVRGATVVVDYAHNAHGLAALVHFASQLPAKRRLVLLSSAGDRSDADIRAIADAARPFGADRTLVADLPNHLRGRAPGEITAVLAAASRDAGAADVAAFPDPPAAVREALAWAQSGDVLLLVTLSHRDEVARLVRDAAA